FPNPVQLVDDLANRRAGHLRLHGGRNHERAGMSSHGERRVRAISEPMTLPQVEVQTRRERPAEYGGHHQEREEVGCVPRNADMAYADLRLDGTRAIDNDDLHTFDPGRDRDRTRGRRVAAPPSQRLFRDLPDFVDVLIARYDDSRPHWSECRSMERHRIHPGQTADGTWRSTHRASECTLRREDVAVRHLVGEGAWICPALHDPGELLVTDPFDLVLRKHGVADQLGGHTHGGRE